MFNDRDIAVIGIGAFASVLCLLIPVAFPWKIGIGFAVLAAAMVAAFIRLGRDRLTLEEYLMRRIRFRVRPKLWTFRMREQPIRTGLWRKRASAPPSSAAPSPAPSPAVERTPAPMPARLPAALPAAWRFENVRMEGAAWALMIVVGFWFMYWLGTGGAAALGADLARLLP